MELKKPSKLNVVTGHYEGNTISMIPHPMFDDIPDFFPEPHTTIDTMEPVEVQVSIEVYRIELGSNKPAKFIDNNEVEYELCRMGIHQDYFEDIYTMTLKRTSFLIGPAKPIEGLRKSYSDQWSAMMSSMNNGFLPIYNSPSGIIYTP